MRAIGASNYDGAAAGRGAEDERRQASCRATRACSRTTTSTSAPASRRSSSRCACKEKVGVIPYYSLASRLPHRQVPLGGRLSARARAAAGVKNYLNERGLRILTALDEVSARLGAKPAQVALAWLHGAAQRDRADRQRHEPRAARGPDRRQRA